MKNYFSVKHVVPLEGYQLLLTFSNGEKRVYDMKPHLNRGIFKQLKDVTLFNTVHISFDTVEWDNEIDFDPEDLYSGSKKVNLKKYSLPHSRSYLAVAESAAEYLPGRHTVKKKRK